MTKTTWIEHIKTIVYAIVLAIIIRGFVFEIFKIPSGSMKDNLLVGDHILVTKYSYGYGPFSMIVPIPLNKRIFFTQPKRGDIIVFRSPYDDDPKELYIKRLIGLPGDTLQVKDGVIYINDKPLQQTLSGEIKDGNKTFKKFLENNPEGINYNVLYDPEYSLSDFPNTTGIYKIPEHYYFFMGDNRNNSIDSRFLQNIGYVHELRLIGKAQYILWNGSIIDNIFSLFAGHRNLINIYN